jgi:DNA primase
MTVLYQGKHIDPLALWSSLGVEFPANFDDDGTSEFSPLVVCPNPDHHTMKRHFQINLKQPMVHCFAGCGISGSYEHAVSMIQGGTQRAARKTILRHSRVATGAPRVRKRGAASVISPVDVQYERFLPQAATEYLASRGISAASIERWELGWDHEALRIVIPAKDARGRVKFLIRRAVKPGVEPRYLYPEGSERNKLLFGTCVIDPGLVRSRGLLLVEGSIDCIIQDQHKLLPVGAILGSKLSEIQAQIIANMRPKVIYTMFDADAAGVSATISVKRYLRSVPIKVCRYPRGRTDPAELTREESERAIARAIDFTAWKRKAGITSPKPSRRKEISFG